MEVDIPAVDLQPHLLISSVRQSYLKFLTDLVCQNYVNWCGEEPPLAVYKCAKYLELCSAAKAMMVPLYRESVLNITKALKQNTRSKELYPELENFCLNPQHDNKGIQTDAADIDMNNCINYNIKSNVTQCKLVDSNQRLDKNKTIANNLVMEDVIMAEMEKLFNNQETVAHDNDDDILFDNFFCDTPQDQTSINDENKCKSLEQNNSTNVNEKSIENVSSVNSLENEIDKVTNPVRCSIVSSSQIATGKKYVYSPWACELFYQKKKLREKLDNICEVNIKRHAKIKVRFVELFGYDSDNEQGLQSPNTSTNFLRSCRQRAVPYLTKHLRKFTDKIRIPKHLLKPLAKHLLYILVDYNQYPRQFFRKSCPIVPKLSRENHGNIATHTCTAIYLVSKLLLLELLLQVITSAIYL